MAPSPKDKQQYLRLKEEFKKVTKRVIQGRELSKNPVTLKSYETDLLQTYNKIIVYLQPRYSKLKRVTQNELGTDLNKLYNRLVQCFKKLNVQISEPEYLLQTVSLLNSEGASTSSGAATETVPHEDIEDLNNSIDLLVNSDSDDDDLSNKFLSLSIEHNDNNQNNGNLNENNQNNDNLNDNNQNNDNLNEENPNNVFINQNLEMAATIPEKTAFLKTCSQYISSKYDGDACGLDSFIESIELLEDITEPNLVETLKKFLRSKTEKVAKEVFPPEPTTIQAIKDALKAAIKPDNPQIVKGKIAALKIKKQRLS